MGCQPMADTEEDLLRDDQARQAEIAKQIHFDVFQPSPQSPPAKRGGWAWRVFEKFRNGR